MIRSLVGASSGVAAILVGMAIIGFVIWVGVIGYSFQQMLRLGPNWTLIVQSVLGYVIGAAFVVVGVVIIAWIRRKTKQADRAGESGSAAPDAYLGQRDASRKVQRTLMIRSLAGVSSGAAAILVGMAIIGFSIWADVIAYDYYRMLLLEISGTLIVQSVFGYFIGAAVIVVGVRIIARSRRKTEQAP